uniref:Uncharacterized protein n=1 Tax=Steinernema glaseri TaxID=37863 RepID=A0A1I8ARX1_9BILA
MPQIPLTSLYIPRQCSVFEDSIVELCPRCPPYPRPNLFSSPLTASSVTMPLVSRVTIIASHYFGSNRERKASSANRVRSGLTGRWLQRDPDKAAMSSRDY